MSAARGLPIPKADARPPPGFMPRPQTAESPRASSQNLNNLTVPIGPRSMSAQSDKSVSLPGSAIPSPLSSTAPGRSSPFKPRTKALAAALSISSRNGSQTDIAPREIVLPHDPFVNGQPLEVFLYKDAIDCPICFLSYPPYLNRTRCCDQPICSECFVQIKRPDPHLPEHHGDGNDTSGSSAEAEQLISEPACCPYCQQPEFGVTYEPPPFRRGTAYSISPGSIGAMNTAMSSNSSLNSANMSPTSATSPQQQSRRRTQSLSANAPNVVTTDRIRPDWATKLAAQRAHMARRAAAATALHTAAFLMGNADSARTFGFSRHGRFSRRNTGNLSNNGDASGSGAAEEQEAMPSVGIEPGPRGSSGRAGIVTLSSRRSRLEDLEEMMMLEAVRLSLAEEEKRQAKAEKEARKEAKKKEKEDKKAAKEAARNTVYGPSGSAGPSSASGSSLSLNLGGLGGRRRGNSGASNLRVEASVANALASQSSSSVAGPAAESSSAATNPNDKGKGVDRGPQESTAPFGGSSDALAGGSSSATVPSVPIPSTSSGLHGARGPSHLRQMSNASSVSSSIIDSAGSYVPQSHVMDADRSPRASGLSLDGHSDAGGSDRDAAHAGTEPLFNFRSLAEMVGVELEGENAGTLRREESETAAATTTAGDTGNAAASAETAGPDAADSASATPEMPPPPLTTDSTAVESGTVSSQTTQQPAVVEVVGSDKEIAPPTAFVTPPTPREMHGDSKQLGQQDRPSVEITQ